jgi:hypothetical protein
MLLANPEQLHFGQGVLHGDLQCLYYHLDDIHTQYLKIEEDIEFLKVLSSKQKPEKSLKAEQPRRLRLLPQIHPDSNLYNECSQVIYKP